MTADPRNPKRGDRFVATPSGLIYEVDYVGTEAMFVHNVETGLETLVILSHAAAYWKPVPEPLVIYERQQSDGWTWWSSSSQATHFAQAQATGRKRILHPDGTWTEEGP